MKWLYTKIVGTPVYDEGSRPIAMVQDLIIDPESGKLLAFMVNSSKRLIITPIDVLSWQDVIHVPNHDAIVEAADVLRVEEVLNGQTKIFHNKVETKSGKFLGRVNDFSVDTSSLMLQKLYVAKGFLGLIRYDGRIIQANDIQEILPGKIVVNEDLSIVREDIEPEVIKDMAMS